MVEEAGFEAVEAANATEAVIILDARSDIRIVFSDIDMPHGLDGMRMAALIRDRWPPIEIILTSGHYDLKDVTLPARSVFFSQALQRTGSRGRPPQVRRKRVADSCGVPLGGSQDTPRDIAI